MDVQKYLSTLEGYLFMNWSSAAFAWYIIIGMLLTADQPIPSV